MKFNYSHIIPECNADTNLVQTLMRVKGINHQKSCGQVTNAMQSHFKDQFAIGIIDLDDMQSKYSEESKVIASSKELSVCRHPGTHHYLIKINNVLESFIVSCAIEAGVELSSLGLPLDKNALMKRTKKKEAKTDPQLSNFFKEIATSSEMILLRNVLKYLNEKKYEANDDEIAEFFKSNQKEH